jgi:hypothetical protein
VKDAQQSRKLNKANEYDSYNSVVFASFGTNLYYPLLVNESFLKPDSPIEPKFTVDDDFGPHDNPNFNIIETKDPPWTDWVQAAQRAAGIGEAKRLKDMYINGGLERLENHDCLKAYATQFQARGSLLLVTSTGIGNPLISTLQGPWATQDWICDSDKCDESSVPAKEIWKNPKTWSFSRKTWNKIETGFVSEPYGDEYYVVYCLSEPQPERCRLQFSLPLAIIVVFFNIAKALCMFSMVYRVDGKTDKSPITNIGDMVASYLQRSDAYTKNMCLVAMDDMRRARWVSQRWDTRRREYKGKRRTRFYAASRTRWTFCCILYVRFHHKGIGYC